MSDKIIKVEGGIIFAEGFTDAVERELHDDKPALSGVRSTADLANQAIVPVSKTLRAREWNMLLGPEDLPVDGTVRSMQTQPRCYFRAERLLFVGELDGVLLTSVFVGRKSEMPQGDVIPCGNWVDVALDWREFYKRDMTTIQPSLMLTMQFKNVSGQPRKMAVNVFGKAIV